MKKLFRILLINFIICGCNTKDYNKESHIINMTGKIQNTIELNTLFSDFEYISLETNENSIFGKINKLIIHKDKYYILDNSSTKQIFQFSNNGEFIKTYGNIGKGPGEYTQIVDFTIDETNDNIIILTHPSIIYCYDKEGKFLYKKDLDCGSLFSIVNYKDGYLISNNNNSNIKGKNAYLIFDFDNKFKLRGKSYNVLPHYLNLLPIISNPFLKSQNTISYFDFFTSTLYYNLKNEKNKSFHFDFKGKKIPEEIFKNSMDFFMNQNDFGFISDVIFIDNILLSWFILSGKSNLSLYDIDTNQHQLFNYKGWMPDLLFHKDGFIYSQIDPINIIENDFLIKEAKQLTKYQITENSNSVIIKFKLSDTFLKL